jgi:hypothetical protein
LVKAIKKQHTFMKSGRKIIHVILVSLAMVACNFQKKKVALAGLNSQLEQIIGKAYTPNCKVYVFSQFDCLSCLDGYSKIIKKDFEHNTPKSQLFGVFYNRSGLYNVKFDSLFKATSFIQWYKTSNPEIINSIENQTGNLFSPYVIKVDKTNMLSMEKIYIYE